MSWGILRRSNRGERPTQQGDGSEKQIPYREAFQNCALLWNSLPAECPEVIPDPPPTSKASVWEAKLEHGVVCSYYDLFMRCCINFALAHGGAMPDGDCFPCVSLCDCEGISIGYTTQGMQTSEQQELTVIGAIDGCTYGWEITGGGGSLSAGSGVSVIYTAPATNPECAGNPTITLSTRGAQCDSLEIAINGYDNDTLIAYFKVDDAITRECTPNPAGWTYCVKHFQVKRYNCKDEYLGLQAAYDSAVGIWWTTGQCVECYLRCTSDAQILANAAADGWYPGEIIDRRIGTMEAMGCCPAGLL